MRVLHSPDHAAHNARLELVPGRFSPSFEVPRRIDVVLAALREAGHGPFDVAGPASRDDLLTVHDAGLVDLIEHGWEEWKAKHGAETDAFPYVWPSRHLYRKRPTSIEGRLGYHSFDATGPIIEGTFRAASASAGIALEGARNIARGERTVFAACRPPGHHASRDMYGGTTFFNNAALAAEALARAGSRVAILDVDVHHGNGTQSIFYDRGDVLFVSIHADPAEDYPYFCGYADEQGEGAGDGFSLNLPLPAGTTWDAYGEALAIAVDRIRALSPDTFVVSLGVDTFERDPLGPFKLRTEDYLRLGAHLRRVGKPTLHVLEGGYAVDDLGTNISNVLAGFEQG